MIAATARLRSTGEQDIALAAGSSYALPGLPVNEILASGLGRPLQDDLLRRRVPVGDDGSLVGALLDDGRPLDTARLPLGLGTLRGRARALLAARMLALRAFLAGAKRRLAEMALAMHAHPNRLLHTQGMALSRVPLAGLELQAIELTELLGALREELGPRDLGGLDTRGCGGLGCSGLGRFAVMWS